MQHEMKLIKEHRELLLDLLYDVSKAHEEAMETMEEDTFWEKWAEMDKLIRASRPAAGKDVHRTYDMVLVEKQTGDGLGPEELCRFADYFPENSHLIPIEIDSLRGDSSAMGFLTAEAEEICMAKHDPEDIKYRIGEILSDLTLMNEANEYEICGLSVYLGWEI